MADDDVLWGVITAFNTWYEGVLGGGGGGDLPQVMVSTVKPESGGSE